MDKKPASRASKKRISISEALREALREADSLYAVHHATDVPKASIIRFLRGEQSLRLDMADRLAEHFNLSLRKNK
jgi:plasmid maintenance system antidote protein VapI